jgi:hypothetical protein
MVAAGAALLMVAPVGLGGASPAKAMTCAADPPIDTACAVVGAVLGTACTGRLPSVPRLPITTASASVGWPIKCPPLG